LTNDKADEKELDIFCAGNAIVDVFAHDETGLALRYGLDKPVQHVEIERLKSLLSELGETTAVSGGGAANAAKVAALLGAKVSFTGAVSDDRFGQIFGEELKAAGVKTLLVEKRSPTGICLMLQTGEGTRIAASPSAALEFSEDDVNEEEIRKAKVVVIDGFMLGRHDIVRRILTLADNYETAAAMDLGSPAIAAEEAAEIAAYIALVNATSFDAASHNTRRHPIFLFMNEDEAVSFHNGLGHGRDRPAAAFEQTREFFKSLTKEKLYLVIVVKLGKLGAVCFANGENFHAAAEAVEAVETTGAGDAFCGAFLAAWARGRSLTECAALGNRAARIVLDGTGTKVDKNAFKDLAALLEASAGA